jgi:hypothetical protein
VGKNISEIIAENGYDGLDMYENTRKQTATENFGMRTRRKGRPKDRWMDEDD